MIIAIALVMCAVILRWYASRQALPKNTQKILFSLKYLLNVTANTALGVGIIIILTDISTVRLVTVAIPLIATWMFWHEYSILQNQLRANKS